MDVEPLDRRLRWILLEPHEQFALPRWAVPSLAYGRHRGPAYFESRRAAVALVLYGLEEASPWLPLTLRPLSLRHHGGQISLPGGRVEPGESMIEAAVREFQEELGDREARLELLGILPQVYVYASDNLVTPVVLRCRSTARFKPDPLEVERVVRFPLRLLNSSQHRCRRRMRRALYDGAQQQAGEVLWDAPYYCLDDDCVWGATAIILAEFATRLESE